MGDAAKPSPPALIYLPPIQATKSTGERIAQMITLRASAGPGSYSLKRLDAAADSASTDASFRISDQESNPVLDVYTYDYHRNLPKAPGAVSEGVGSAVSAFVARIQQFALTLWLLSSAGHRAKSFLSRMQVALGAVIAVLFGIMVLVTGPAVLVAVGVDIPGLPTGVSEGKTFAAVALTALTTWLSTVFLPVAKRVSDVAGQLIDYARDQRRAENVTSGLQQLIDKLLDAQPGREIHIFGYSFGALVAVDFLFPPASLHVVADPRLVKSVKSLSTVGCPADFVRLYEREYLEGREPRVADLPWTNVFIAADVFGSNFLDGDYDTEPPDKKNPPIPTGAKRTSYRYTDRKLRGPVDILLTRGFAMHMEYWGEPAEAGCIHLVMETACPQLLGSPV